MEPMDRVLQHAVGIGDTFVLTQMVKPGFHQEGLHHPSFGGSVFEYPPRISTVTATLVTKPFKRGEE